MADLLTRALIKRTDGARDSLALAPHGALIPLPSLRAKGQVRSAFCRMIMRPPACDAGHGWSRLALAQARVWASGSAALVARSELVRHQISGRSKML
jgi:hypothetical protein